MKQLRIADCGLRIGRAALLLPALVPAAAHAQALSPLPDTSGFGVHVLAIARAPDKSIWVGSYGAGVFVLRPGAGSWEQLRHSSDTTARSISWDFVHAFRSEERRVGKECRA